MKTTRGFWRARPAIAEGTENGTAAVAKPKSARRPMKVILTLALSGSAGGFLISHAFTPLYESESEIFVGGQKIPPDYVHSLVTADFTQYADALQNTVLSTRYLQSMIQGLNLAKPGEEAKLMENIRSRFEVAPTMTLMTATTADQKEGSRTKKEPSGFDEPMPVFIVRYTDSEPERAQKICNALTSMLLEENLKFRAAALMDVVQFLNRQVEEVKHKLDEQDAVVAKFKQQHMGQLHADGRSMNPTVEEQYKALTRDNDANEAFYRDLLVKKNDAELSLNMENQQLGQQMAVLSSASRPEAPEFPGRPLFALGGLCAGLVLGIGRLLWPAARTLFERLALLFPTSAEIE